MNDFRLEDKFTPRIVAGIDEAGRGPLAGPVVAAAVIVDRNYIIDGIKDSKKLSAKKREELYAEITSKYQYTLGIVSPAKIDKINILQATINACRLAAESLNNADMFLIDGNMQFANPSYISIIKGDDLSYSIAAASIVAKVTRDRIMHQLHQEYPIYGWNSNSGYGSKAHIEAIRNHGLSPYHRRSFKPKNLDLGVDLE